ncbi:helix-turn-helix domain-containing protein [uncultured Oscillibacter sp.]|uniref:helix-turn-helix domain-containing protein n=1 Tax=uncultured Oscillibacter sp. TaxID=876091 RepID=UPI0025F2D23A|nr:helix-turn-helix domain-containing protein [uncultured Oscillibacter sp.]
MSSPNYRGREPLPLTVIHSAKAGDSEAIGWVLRYYEEYINKLCTQTFYDETGCPHRCVDEYMKRRLEAKLTQVIIFMN